MRRQELARLGDPIVRTIYKYPLSFARLQSVSMPKGANILCVQLQRGTACLWAVVDPCVAENRQRTLVMIPTGEEFEVAGIYIGTIQMDQETVVLHVFDLTPPSHR
jgi:hypothetical protein